MEYEIKISHKDRYTAHRVWLTYWGKDVFKRSLILALIICGMLTLINQPTAVFSSDKFVKLQLILAFITPFVVITLSQLGAKHQADIDRSKGRLSTNPERFITMVLKHNIPFRALIISMVIGSVSSVIILTSTVIQTGGVENIPWPQLVQSYVLPFIFGAFSQALTYRRNIAK